MAALWKTCSQRNVFPISHEMSQLQGNISGQSMQEDTFHKNSRYFSQEKQFSFPPLVICLIFKKTTEVTLQKIFPQE